MTPKYPPNSEPSRTEKSKLLKTFFPIITTGRILATMALPKSSRPETMIRREEELVEFYEFYDDEIEHEQYCKIILLEAKKSPLIKWGLTVDT